MYSPHNKETNNKTKRSELRKGRVATIMDAATKTKIKQEFQIHERDTGSSEVQVALLSKRIDELTEHLKSHKKDHSSRYGLIKMVSARRSLLDYVKRKNEEGYRNLIKRLKLRR